MALDTNLKGVTSGTGAEVNTANELRVTGGSATVNNAGYTVVQYELDAGSLRSGATYRKSPLVSEDQRMNVGLDTPQFDYTFNATSQNTNTWKVTTATTTMALTQSSGFLNLNSGNVGTANAAVGYSTNQTFTLRGNASSHYELMFSKSTNLAANQTFELGLFNSTATGAAPAAPADGAYWRYTSAGLIGVVNYNGTETPSGVLVADSAIPINTVKFLKIILSQAAAEFWYDGKFAGELTVPAGNGTPFMSTGLPYTIQARNTAAVSGGTLLKFAGFHTDQNDLNLELPFPMQQARLGLGAYQGQDGGTMGSTAVIGSSTAAAAAIVNSSATAQFTGLGGFAQILPTLTAGTDGIIFAYQNPVGGINQTPRTMVICGAYISSAVQTALTGGPVIYAYSLQFGIVGGSPNLAAAESASFAAATTKAPRRLPLGIQGYAAAAAAGTAATPIYVPFICPVIVHPGEWVTICARNLGVVTTAGAIAVSGFLDGYNI
jgi:hypothetical protein